MIRIKPTCKALLRDLYPEDEFLQESGFTGYYIPNDNESLKIKLSEDKNNKPMLFLFMENDFGSIEFSNSVCVWNKETQHYKTFNVTKVFPLWNSSDKVWGTLGFEYLCEAIHAVDLEQI